MRFKPLSTQMVTSPRVAPDHSSPDRASPNRTSPHRTSPKGVFVHRRDDQREVLDSGLATSNLGGDGLGEAEQHSPDRGQRNGSIDGDVQQRRATEHDEHDACQDRGELAWLAHRVCYRYDLLHYQFLVSW